MSVLASGDQLSYRPYCEVHSRSDHIARSEFAAPCDSNSGVIIPTERSMEQQREIRHRGRADQLAIRNSVGLGKKSKGEDQYEEGKCAVCFTKDQVYFRFYSMFASFLVLMFPSKVLILILFIRMLVH